ncbi:MAG: hypothetical protein ACK4MF_11455, partial [Hyphomicrobiaceae bacterium]
MVLRRSLRLARYAMNAGGVNAPVVLSRYAALTLLNRTSRRRLIRACPAPLQTPGTANAVAAVAFDVVVPVYNNFDDTALLLDRLRYEAGQIGEIIIVHDASSDARIGPLLRSFAAD